MKQILSLLISSVAVVCGAASPPAFDNGASSEPLSSLPRPSSTSTTALTLTDQPPRSLADDETYEAIMSMQNDTIPFKCYVAVAYLVLWCDIGTPPGFNVTAEIKDGTCDDFVIPAQSPYYMEGVASPIFRPDISEEEKLLGTFTHNYCARMDVMYMPKDMNGYVIESLLHRKFPMEITYNYREKVDSETGEVNEELNSATLSDEDTKAEERAQDLALGLGVLAGAIVTMALVAIIYGGKKKKKAQRRFQEREAERQQEEGGGGSVEAAPMVSSERDENEII